MSRRGRLASRGVVEESEAQETSRRADGDHRHGGEPRILGFEGVPQVQAVGSLVDPGFALTHEARLDVSRSRRYVEQRVRPQAQERSEAERAVGLGPQERGVARSNRFREARHDASERGLPGLTRHQLLGIAEKVLQVLETAPHQVALFPHLVEGGRELIRRLGIRLHEGLVGASVRAQGGLLDSVVGKRDANRAPLDGGRIGQRAWRGRRRRAGGGLRLRGGGRRCCRFGRDWIRLDGQGGRPEDAEDRLVGPLLERVSLLLLDDLVALREVLHRSEKDRPEGLENALPSDRHGRHRVDAARIEGAVHELDGGDLGEIALVVLDHQGHGGWIELVVHQVLGHLPEALDVLLPPIRRGVRDEDHGVGALQHEAAGRGIHGLAGDGEDLELQVEAPEAARLHGQQVEENGPVLGRVHGDHLAPARCLGILVEDLEIGGLSADRGTVVDDLDLDRPLSVIQLDQLTSRPISSREGPRTAVN